MKNNQPFICLITSVGKCHPRIEIPDYEPIRITKLLEVLSILLFCEVCLNAI